MLLVHDIVEIDAGDTFVYDDGGPEPGRPSASSRRRPHLRPAPRPAQRAELRGAWDEFEPGPRPEARFARAVDRLAAAAPELGVGRGAAWREHGITADRVRAGERHDRRGLAPELWGVAQRLIDDAVARGWLPEP